MKNIKAEYSINTKQNKQPIVVKISNNRRFFTGIINPKIATTKGDNVASNMDEHIESIVNHKIILMVTRITIK
ncbi:hypothetical protein CAXC1_70062 [Candidatus Xenohaliotis californiensis]|uniref:Uncharacterized protein n=1 Tax=Candidatus Xenohaliotis californiensis TaxID=84677 RepID=A0ABM9N9D2_9RICK|nr:hypothetical protein CAXC1_70062 [Candidatus Xenohaliotis californiensis]